MSNSLKVLMGVDTGSYKFLHVLIYLVIGSDLIRYLINWGFRTSTSICCILIFKEFYHKNK